MFHLTPFSRPLHNQALGSFHPSSADTAGDTWTEWAEHDWSIMKELCKRGFHLFLLLTHTFFTRCIPPLILFKNHHTESSPLFLFCSLLFIYLILPPLFFYSVLSILCPAFFCWRCSRFTHPHTHIHSHWSFPEWNSVTPRWVFGGVQTAMGWEKNSPCRVWPRRQTILVAACAKEHLPIHENRKIC